MSTQATSPAPETGPAPTWPLVRRLLALAWEYRGGCVHVIAVQLSLLTLGMLGLGLVGLGVDFIRYAMVHPAGAAGAPVPTLATPAGDAAALSPVVAKPPRWPWGIAPPDDWSRMETLAAIAAALLVFALVRALLNTTYAIVVNRLVQGQIVVALRARVYDKMQRLSFRFFDANASGSLINRVTGDVQAVRSFVDGVVMQSLILVLSLAVYLVYMTHIHARLTLACLATTPLLWILTASFSRAVRPAYRRNRDLFDNQVRVLSENVQGVHVVKGFARQKQEDAKFDAAAVAVRQQSWWIFGKISVFQPLISFLTHVNLAVMLAYGGWLVVCHERAPDADTAARVGISIGQLLVFTGLLQQFSGQVANISNIANSIQQSLTGAQRVFEVLDTPVEVASAPNALPLPRIRGDVRFEKVRADYKPGEAVLNDVTFEVKAGQRVAILGATGSGKSTLLSLIPRFYDPVAGRVTVDGHDVRDLNLDDLRRAIGLVFQESFLFSSTIAANISFGHPEATRAQVEKAARIAAAHDFITAMPQGYDTVLREGGQNLSGGQRQRLAIARAILLEPAILLMDDPTASIDPETESDILQAMENAMAGRTTFIVAHRLSTLRRADLVLVLDRGRIAEAGTHAELMRTQGHYTLAARIQMADPESRRLLGEEPLADETTPEHTTAESRDSGW